MESAHIIQERMGFTICCDDQLSWEARRCGGHREGFLRVGVMLHALRLLRIKFVFTMYLRKGPLDKVNSVVKSAAQQEHHRVLCSYSTSIVTSSAADDSLYRRISRAGNPSFSMVPILDQWVQEGRSVSLDELRFLVKRLKHFKRFKHSLEVFEWMTTKRSLSLSRRDAAVHLNLISKVHGLEQAERYFNNLPCSVRAPQSYGALLNCYANSKSLEKAEAIMQKLKSSGSIKTPFAYNVMMKLYFILEMYEKLDSIMKEMEEKGISLDKLTYGIRLNAFAATTDIKGMESFLMKMEADPLHTMDWNDYVVAANGYLKAGCVDKSITMLKKAEKLATGMTKKVAYHHLLTMYARAKSKEDVYRILDLYKGSWDVYNKGYCCMVSSLIILDDLEGAEKILLDRHSGSADSGFHAVNLVMRAYCEKGDLEKAEALVKREVESGKAPPAISWDILAAGYRKHNQMEAAIMTTKKALLSDQRGWKPDKVTLAACVDYLKLKGCPKEVEEFMTLLRDHICNLETLLGDNVND
ncbi:hypothetical protein Nepgr_014448 [Nepenthes gracilis]|uniref:Pentatricopeptide repeat-containing protein n=1 Tax=Nepenthes gracilis TaxID=150966 RepID=A0AAD3SK27_NEPGR|nr:hypothetical protein Nepgr_014448 [Nepenthes gracilis]